MKKDNENQMALKNVKQEDVNKQGFIKRIKTRWLISRANTLLLIAILIAIFILLNIFVKKLDITPIDLSLIHI